MIDDNVRKWIIKAAEDFKVAEHEMERKEEEIVTSAVCFHCQQSVEKLLKAYLVLKNKDFERTHNLEHLLDICSQCDLEFKKLDMGNLTDYAVEIRYPDEFIIPSIEEAKECFKIAAEIRDFVFKKLDIKENNRV